MPTRKNSHIIVLVLALITVAIMLGSCKREKTHILSQKKIENVLYDFHVAEAMASESGTDSAQAEGYMDAVLNKYDITQEEFDTSMKYYLRHADILNDIYQRLTDRINNEAQLLGINVLGGSSDEMEGDTANIWTAEPSRVFFIQQPFNMMKYSVKTDTTFHAGDKLTLKFRSDFLYQDGTRNGLALLCVKLQNDSIITRTMTISSSSNYSLDVTDTENKGIKEVKCVFMLRKGNYDEEKNSSTLRMMYLNNISLIRMHKKEDNKENNNNNNEKTDSAKLARPDSATITKQGMHQLHSR